MRKFVMLNAVLLSILLVSCSTSKNNTALRANRTNIHGNWTITNIQVNLPAGFGVTEVFGTAPYNDFMNSNWNLIRNGNGSFDLTNGTHQNIFWSFTTQGTEGQLTFKKLNPGEKAKNVSAGYILDLSNLTANSFDAISEVRISNDKTGTVIFTFTKQ